MKKILMVLIMVLFASPVYGEPRIDDQGNSNMCVAYSVCNAIEYQMELNGLDTYGIDKKWMDREARKVMKEKPDLNLIAAALYVAYDQGMITTYSAINVTPGAVKAEIDQKHMVIINCRYTRDWNDGLITEPTDSNKVQHATYLYDYNEEWLIGANSWGTDYGFNGSYKMDYDYFYFPNVIAAYVFEVKIEP